MAWVYDARMAEGGTSRKIRSEARGPHWIAWIVAADGVAADGTAADGTAADGKPEGSVVLVGKTREEAEERARVWEKKGGAAG